MFQDREQAVVAQLGRWMREPYTAPVVQVWRNAFLDLEMSDGQTIESVGPACRCSMYLDGVHDGSNPCMSMHVHSTSIREGRDAARFMYEVFTAKGKRFAILCAQCGMAARRVLRDENPDGLMIRYIGDTLAEEAKWHHAPTPHMRAVNVRLLTDAESRLWIARTNGSLEPTIANPPKEKGVQAPERPQTTRYLMSA